jgi:hypothetical protein
MGAGAGGGPGDCGRAADRRGRWRRVAAGSYGNGLAECRATAGLFDSSLFNRRPARHLREAATSRTHMSEQDSLPASADPVIGRCENCGKPLYGEYCYACGQSVKGLVRHFTSIAGDFADTVLNYDSRLPRTLWPLFAKPAYLAREYFAGRRVRYVSPVRLFVTLAIVTFFVARLAISFGDNFQFDGDGGKGNINFSQATTVEDVIQQRDEALASMADARKQNSGVPGLAAGLAEGERQMRKAADARIAQLQRGAKATPATKPGSKPAEPPPLPADTTSDDEDDALADTLSFNGSPWNAKTNPLTVQWWPQFANDWLNAQIGRAKKNIKRMKDDPEIAKDALLGAVPSTLFILLPVFALMLKLLYVFKRRLYMEHLIVALHSHAFLCLSLLLVFGAMALRDWLAPGFLHGLLGWVETALWIWMPVYLLLMQKRIYAQGWIMTLLKYSILGFCYCFLLGIGAIFTVMFSLVYG